MLLGRAMTVFVIHVPQILGLENVSVARAEAIDDQFTHPPDIHYPTVQSCCAAMQHHFCALDQMLKSNFQTVLVWADSTDMAQSLDSCDYLGWGAHTKNFNRCHQVTEWEFIPSPMNMKFWQDQLCIRGALADGDDLSPCLLQCFFFEVEQAETSGRPCLLMLKALTLVIVIFPPLAFLPFPMTAQDQMSPVLAPGLNCM